MARTSNKLTARSVASLTTEGFYGDGGGLFFDVSEARTVTGRNGTITRAWVFLCRSPVHRVAGPKGREIGKQRRMGLGPYGLDQDKVSLAVAREMAEAARKLIREGKDPIDERRKPTVVAPTVPTFGEIADALIKAMSPGWRNPKHRAQWDMTMREYAAPLRPKPVDQIATADVLAVLQPIWQAIPETASRVRGRIEAVLDAAKAQGHRSGENPAAWRGHLKHILPARQRLTRGHHDAMSWEDVPAFVAALRQRQGVAALALEFLILTAVRSGEARGARWVEFDLAAKVWTIPADRMKAGAEHRVPLTPRMLAILDTVKPMHLGDGLVFASNRPGKPLSDMTLSAVLGRMKVENATPHGFRSSFRDWAGSATSYPRELAEEALAHVIGSKVERAYRRQDALERRREMMAAWEKFVGNPPGENMLPMRKAEA